MFAAAAGPKRRISLRPESFLGHEAIVCTRLALGRMNVGRYAHAFLKGLSFAEAKTGPILC